MRVVFVQWGDYADGARQLARGGDETYLSQRYSLEYVEALAKRAERVCVICFAHDRAEEVVSGGVHTRGVEVFPDKAHPRYPELLRVLEEEAPTHMVLTGTILPALAWARKRRVRTLPLFADSLRRRPAQSRALLAARSRAQPPLASSGSRTTTSPPRSTWRESASTARRSCPGTGRPVEPQVAAARWRRAATCA
jgi:hypothetical protein